MYEQVKLSEAQWALVTELLQREHDELPVEIRHTRSASFREDLHRRYDMVQEILDRLRTPAIC